MDTQTLSFQQWQEAQFFEQSTTFLSLSQSYTDWLRENPQGYLCEQSSSWFKQYLKELNSLFTET